MLRYSLRYAVRRPEFWGIVSFNLLYWVVFPILWEKWKTWKKQRNTARNQAAIEQANREEYQEEYRNILDEIRAKSDRVYVIRKKLEKYDPELPNG